MLFLNTNSYLYYKNYKRTNAKVTKLKKKCVVYFDRHQTIHNILLTVTNIIFKFSRRNKTRIKKNKKLQLSFFDDRFPEDQTLELHSIIVAKFCLICLRRIYACTKSNLNYNFIYRLSLYPQHNTTYNCKAIGLYKNLTLTKFGCYIRQWQQHISNIVIVKIYIHLN